MNYQNIMDIEWIKWKKLGISTINFPKLTITKRPKNITENEMEIYTWMNRQYNDPNSKIKFDKMINKTENKPIIIEKDLEELRIWNELKSKGISVEWVKKAEEVGIDIVN